MPDLSRREPRFGHCVGGPADGQHVTHHDDLYRITFRPGGTGIGVPESLYRRGIYAWEDDHWQWKGWTNENDGN